MLVREASQRDYLSIQRLMTKAGVSITGEEQDKPQFLVVENEQQMLIGMVGVEKKRVLQGCSAHSSLIPHIGTQS